MSTSALARTSRWVSRSKILLHFQTKLILTSFSTDTGTADKDNDPGRPGPPPIRVLLTESAGRGVFATRRIGAGELIHTAKPVVAHPSLSKIHSVCYFCLRNLKTTCQSQTQAVQFCNEECEEQSKAFYDIEKRANWSAYDDYCQAQGLKYPLLVKRLACMVISGFAAADSLDILQPATLSPLMISENAEARLKALHDVEEGEELRICYIDASMGHDARQTLLSKGFGFQCNCLRCLSRD